MATYICLSINCTPVCHRHLIGDRNLHITIGDEDAGRAYEWTRLERSGHGCYLLFQFDTVISLIIPQEDVKTSDEKMLMMM